MIKWLSFPSNLHTWFLCNWQFHIIFEPSKQRAFQIAFHFTSALSSFIEKCRKQLGLTNNLNWFFHAPAELSTTRKIDKIKREQLNEPLMERSILLNFYLPLLMAWVREFELSKCPEMKSDDVWVFNSSHQSVIFSFISCLMSNGKIMLQIAISIVFQIDFNSYFSNFRLFYCHCNSDKLELKLKEKEKWPSLEQCVSSSNFSFIEGLLTWLDFDDDELELNDCVGNWKTNNRAKRRLFLTPTQFIFDSKLAFFTQNFGNEISHFFPVSTQNKLMWHVSGWRWITLLLRNKAIYFASISGISLKGQIEKKWYQLNLNHF